MIIKSDNLPLDQSVLTWLDEIHKRTKADVFLVDPEELSEDGTPNASSKERLNVVIYGDLLTKENAKIHVLVMIDRTVCYFPLRAEVLLTSK
jgi:hypothetical protein